MISIGCSLRGAPTEKGPFPTSSRLRAVSGTLTLRTLLGFLCCLGGLLTTWSASLSDHAATFRMQLADKIMPYWFDTAIDKVHGGYLLADAGEGPGKATEKQLVGQTRMIWGFSHAHIKGLSTPQRSYLKAAEQGYRFLQTYMKDAENGGYFWKTDVAGKPTDTRKLMYGHAFVLYALVEYHRASGDPEPLLEAHSLFRTLQAQAYDRVNGGWVEHFNRNWRPIIDKTQHVEVEVAGYKSANTHLHLMEAFAELCAAGYDPEVRKALSESLQINKTHFYPLDPAQSAFHRRADWGAVRDESSAGLSYGHNVEFAWLMLRAERVLNREPSWNHFYAHLDHALAHGYDHKLGGLYNRGIENQPATQTDKVWWAQAELIAALSDALRHRRRGDYEGILTQELNFLQTHGLDPKDGIWFDTLHADGKPKVKAKAHSWKANYHDVRAIFKFVEVFGPFPKKTAAQSR